MTYITKNHKTTSILVAVAALAAVLVAAGTIATAPGSYHSAFAKKKGANQSISQSFQNSGIAVPTITAQEQQCSTAGDTSPIDTSCTATSTNTVDESGGIVK